MNERQFGMLQMDAGIKLVISPFRNCIEWVINVYENEQYVSSCIMARKSYVLIKWDYDDDDNDDRFMLDHHAEFDFYSAISLKQ
jgi:hypothetical protein